MKRITTIISLLLVCAAIWALPTLTELFPDFSESRIADLKGGAVIEAITSNGQKISDITPQNTQGTKLALAADSLQKGFSVSSVSFIPYPENFAKLSAEDKEVTLYNLLRSISTQKGITYISHMAGDKPTVLFKDAYMISNPDKKNSRVADPVSTKVPQFFSCYAYQKDNRFGSNIYSVNYSINDGDFLMDISNYTKMKYMGFTCVGENELHMYLEVIEAEEGFVLFTNAIVADRDPEVQVLFITVDLPSAFLRRTTALAEWFEARVNAL